MSSFSANSKDSANDINIERYTNYFELVGELCRFHNTLCFGFSMKIKKNIE